MDHFPKISVLIPSYNHDQFIKETILSIWNQTYSNIEIIIVDDCSTDMTLSIATNLQKDSPIPMKIYRNKENLGPVKTVNKALNFCSGDFFTPFASDDLFKGNRYEAQVNHIRQNPDSVIIFGNGYAFDKTGDLYQLHNEFVQNLLTQKPEQILEYLYTHISPFFLQTSVIKTSFIKGLGGFDENGLVDDWALNIKIFKNLSSQNQYSFVNQYLICYRIHEGSISKNYDRQKKLLLETIEKYTPKTLKSQAKGNIYWEISKGAFATGRVQEGLKLLTSSLLHYPDVAKLPPLIKRLFLGNKRL